MAVPAGISHVAMSVPEGTLTDEFRAQLLDFYGRLLGWSEMESLRRPDRMTVSMGAPLTYVNLRERADVMACTGYEHIGVLVRSADDFRRIWDDLDAETQDVELEPFPDRADGGGSFRFRHLLPMAIEVQFFPDAVT
jgi:hypothetical protein